MSWGWKFEGRFFVLRDRTGKAHTAIRLLPDGRWSWFVPGRPSGCAMEIGEAVRQAVAALDFHPDIAKRIAVLAQEAIEAGDDSKDDVGRKGVDEGRG